MSKFFSILCRIVILSLIAIIVSCAPSEKKPSELVSEKYAAPSDLKVESFDHRMELSWKTNRKDAAAISGYNIYISTEPLTASENSKIIKPDTKPFNLTPYPGDDDPETIYETFTADGLQNGIPYYVAVATLYPGQIESFASNIVKLACYPRGTITVKDRSMGSPQGFSFQLGEAVEYNALENDLYFIARDIGNMLGSPDRNEGVLKHTEFAELGGVKDLDEKHDYRNLAYKDRIFVAEDNVYMIRLADGSLAKILVRQVDSSAFKKQIIFDYIYFGQ